jgi:ferredoxin
MQRIEPPRSHADKENREIRDGEVITACQQACPTEAITFGNINDPDSQGRQAQEAAAHLRRAGRPEHPPAHDLRRRSVQLQSGIRTGPVEHEPSGQSAKMDSATKRTMAGFLRAAQGAEARMATKDIKVNDPMLDPITGEVRVIAPGSHLQIGDRKDLPDRAHLAHAAGLVRRLLLASSVATLVAIAVTWLFLKGVGIWGITQPVAWGFAIINFVWWIGIGHAGTLISAILLLFKQQWRNSINRFAEAMTIFAVVCAGMFPLIHVGRPWLGYWLFPIPTR